ncbi:sigma-70-like protein [Microbacterium sp. AG1240]|uniref:sigma factor n=1 Tax=Microbacterium sp. AG1240 TaxID=2183992 RepID=UPI000EB19230|nr:sigma factor [Microbacterium sp. AG1240]RKT36115.1 sigma-70-like protein [Microbacterium sp. AG1240]
MTTLLPAPVDDGVFPPDLDELMARVAQGDTEAFAEVYDLSSSRVLGLITQIGRGRAPAEEIMLDVFTTVWRTAPEYRASDGPAWAWVVRIAARLAIADRRHAHPGVAATS